MITLLEWVVRDFFSCTVAVSAYQLFLFRPPLLYCCKHCNVTTINNARRYSCQEGLLALLVASWYVTPGADVSKLYFAHIPLSHSTVGWFLNYHSQSFPLVEVVNCQQYPGIKMKQLFSLIVVGACLEGESQAVSFSIFLIILYKKK